MNRSPSTSGAQRTSTQVNTTQVNTTHVLPHQVRAIGAAAFLKLGEEKRFLAKKKKKKSNPLFECVQRDPRELRCVVCQRAVCPVSPVIPVHQLDTGVSG